MVMLEQRILLITKYRALLNQIITSILSLLHPFVWENAGIIPIVPRHLYDVTDALFPYIYGIKADADNDYGKDFINRSIDEVIALIVSKSCRGWF